MSLLIVLLGASSLVLFASGLPGFAARGPRRRIEPYLPETRDGALSKATTQDSFGNLLGPFIQILFLEPPRVTARRLVAAGSHVSVERFRIERLVTGAAVGLVVSLTLTLMQRSSGSSSVGPILIAGALAAFSASAARDKMLEVRIQRRSRQLVAQLPLALDLLSIAVTAGESVPAALKRVSRCLEGSEIGQEYERILADIRSGTPTVRALEAWGRDSSDHRVQRFARALALAIENGTPVASVLNGQAADAREAERRTLLETGAKREIWMLIPIVFLLLPTVVLIVFYPSLVALDMFVK